MSVEFLRDSRLHTRDSRDSSLQRVRPKKQHVWRDSGIQRDSGIHARDSGIHARGSWVHEF